MSSNNNQIGALWQSAKRTSRGEVYFTGTINGKKVVMFKNDKKAPNHPDYLIYKQIEHDGPPPPSDRDQ
jgi:uncharacterized protein (DUF736 family)